MIALAQIAKFFALIAILVFKLLKSNLLFKKTIAFTIINSWNEKCSGYF